MRITDWLLLLIAALMAGGIGVFVWNAKKRTLETQMMQTAMYAIASADPHFKLHEPVPVTFDPSVNKALVRFSRTAIDIQGMIELAARYLVANTSPEALEGMVIPDDWTRATAKEE